MQDPLTAVDQGDEPPRVGMWIVPPGPWIGYLPTAFRHFVASHGATFFGTASLAAWKDPAPTAARIAPGLTGRLAAQGL